MADKMKLSDKATKDLELLNSKLNLRRNIICRIALSVSLDTPDGFEVTDDNNLGQEFNKSTILSTDEFAFLAMIADQSGKPIEISDAFNTVVRYHIIRGLSIMTEKYSKINSPSEFMHMLCKGVSSKKEETFGM